MSQVCMNLCRYESCRMSSNKRKDEIQKSVEDSILEAVTRLQNENESMEPFPPPESTGGPPSDLPDLISEQSLWNIANKAAPNRPNFSEIPQSQSFNFDPKIFGELSRSTTVADSQPRPPVFKDERQSDQSDSNEGSQLHTMAAQPALKIPSDNRVASFGVAPDSLANLNNIQLKLYESDHLKIAQQRIEDLEKEVDRLRLENERLASASDLFQKRAEENLTARQELEKKLEFNDERYAEERLSLKNHIESRDSVIQELRAKVEDLESRLSNDIRKSRSRERELENRLELARLEKISLVGSKDEIILDLKRQIDQLNHELGNYRRKAAELNQTIEANQEQFRRTVRALRLALTNLEVNEQIGVRSKKAE